jgi:chromosome segregation ATPase
MIVRESGTLGILGTLAHFRHFYVFTDKRAKRMENINKNQDVSDEAPGKDKDPANVESEQRDAHELEDIKQFLKAENKTYKADIERLAAKIDELDSSMVPAREHIVLFEERIAEYPNSIEVLKSRNKSLLAEINRIKLKIKVSKEDEENVMMLRNTVAEEYVSLKNEKAILVTRINAMEDAIRESSSERERKLPQLKEYDTMLRDTYNDFQEARSRMEVSIKLKQR